MKKKLILILLLFCSPAFADKIPMQYQGAWQLEGISGNNDIFRMRDIPLSIGVMYEDSMLSMGTVINFESIKYQNGYLIISYKNSSVDWIVFPSNTNKHFVKVYKTADNKNKYLYTILISIERI